MKTLFRECGGLVIVIGIILLIVIWAIIPERTESLEPEFKIFSVCLEGKKFAVAMKPNAISISAIFSWSHGGQMRCK